MIRPPAGTRSILAPRLQCTRCGHVLQTVRPESFAGLVQCDRHRCRQWWWAIRLEHGPTAHQVGRLSYGLSLAERAMLQQSFGLPDRLQDDVFWELSVTGHQLRVYDQIAGSYSWPVFLFRLREAPVPAPVTTLRSEASRLG